MAGQAELFTDTCKQIITLATAVIGATLAVGLQRYPLLLQHDERAVLGCFFAGLAIAFSLIFCFCASGKAEHVVIPWSCKWLIVPSWVAFLASIFFCAWYVVPAI